MDDWLLGVLIVVLVAIACVAIGGLIADIARANITRESCESLGFDGQIEVNGEAFCYTTCPFDLAISGECVP